MVGTGRFELPITLDSASLHRALLAGRTSRIRRSECKVGVLRGSATGVTAN